MYSYSDQILEKWKDLIYACKAYYIDSIPTGMSDSTFDELERKAIVEDKFFVRDYIFQTYLKGVKTENKWIEKIKKTKVEGCTMLEALKNKEKEVGEEIFCDLKYDGSSLAIYLDPSTGIPKRVVTVGNLNINDYGVDQTWKLLKFLPQRFPKGIVAIQAEALIDLNRLIDINPDTARQKANGLINSKYCEHEINQLLTLRAYRYYISDDQNGTNLKNYIINNKLTYRDVLYSFGRTYSPIDNHILFAPADVWTLKELESISSDFTESDKTNTSTGMFLNDGWVVYDKFGVCRGALKFSGAGENTEIIKTKVNSIQWNSQLNKGKDSWSANVIIDPVTVKGCIIKKPSAGSVSKLVKNNITPGAEISIIMANSTIPMVGNVYRGGNGNFMWPTCSCGYKMSEKDIYGSLLKCGNSNCKERFNRMISYLETLTNIPLQLDLNKLLVIDRFKWETTSISIINLLRYVELNDIDNYYKYLSSFLTTDLQKKNLNLVYYSSFKALREIYEKYNRD